MTLQATNPGKWLKTFFEEKDLENQIYEAEVNGNIHLIDTETVIGLIQKAKDHEKVTIMNMLSHIDFQGGDIHHFLKHLAFCYARQCYARWEN
ncbi:hypothetical protein R0J87_15525 [Halomonas sp. SIMBA_159]